MGTRRAYLAAVATAALAGCTGGEPGDESTTTPSATETRATEPPTTAPATETPTPTTASGPSPSVDSASLLLNWKPSGLHVPYYVAKARGYYEQEGLPLTEIKTGKGSDFSAKQAGLGKVAFAVTSSDQVINVASRGLSPLSVGVVMQKSPVVVFSTRESLGEPLEDIDQLAGKTVGTGPGMVRILTKLLLERTGVLGDVELVDTGYDTVQKLLAGDVDAAGGVFGDAISARARGYTVDSIRVAETVPSYGHVVATGADYAASNPDAVRAFLRATARGAAWAHRNPEGAIDALVEANPTLSETRAQQRERWTVMADRFMTSATVSERGWGYSTAEPWATTERALADADLTESRVDPTTVWTNEYLDEGYRYIGSYAAVVSG